MTIQQIYDLAIEMGIAADPRGEEKVKKILARRKREAKDLSPKKKKYFDPESLTNPYSDSRILFGDPKRKVRKLIAGIDAGAAEVLLMDRLNQKGEGIDLLISHHPSGHAFAALHEVLDLEVDVFAKAGVPENVAHALLEKRKQEVMRRVAPINHGQAVDAARLLGIPLLALHTIWDNLGDQFLEKYIRARDYESIGDLMEHIQEVPEFAEAAKGKNAPFLASGTEESRVGKILVDFTGGTSPSKELLVQLARAGVGTYIAMHVPEEGLEELKKLHINVIDCGHMAADSIGANIFLDELERRGIVVIPSSGLIRVKRKEKFV